MTPLNAVDANDKEWDSEQKAEDYTNELQMEHLSIKSEKRERLLRSIGRMLPI